MAEESVGSIVVNLLFKTNAPAVLSQISGQSIATGKDLDRLVQSSRGFTVVADGNSASFKKLIGDSQRYAAANQPIVNVLNELRTSTAQTTQEQARAGAVQDEVSGKMEGGTAAFRRFLQEQRLQNRLARETSQAVTGIAFAMAFFTQGSDDANSSMKAVSQSMLAGVAAMNAAEFSLFSLSQAGAKLPGTLGMIATQLGGIAGIAGVVVGVGTALWMFFSRTNEEAKKAAEEGLKNFRDALDLIPIEAKKEIIVDLNVSTEKLKEQLRSITIPGEKIITRVGVTVGPERIRPGMEEEAKGLQGELERREKIRDVTEEQIKKDQERAAWEGTINDILLGKLGSVVDIEKQIKTIREEQSKIRQNEPDGLERIQKANDQIAALEQKRADLFKTTSERLREQSEAAERQYEAGTITAVQYRNILNTTITQTTEEKDRLAIKEKIKSLSVEQMSIIESEYNAEKISSAEYIRQLEIQRSVTTNIIERNQIEEKIRTAYDEQITRLEKRLTLGTITSGQLADELIAQAGLLDTSGDFVLTLDQRLDRYGKIYEMTKKQQEIEQTIQLNARKAMAETIAGRYDRDLEVERIRHDERMKAIDVERDKAIAAGANVAEVTRAWDTMRYAERVKHEQNQGKIALEHGTEAQRLRIDNVVDEEKRIEAKYDLEKELLFNQLRNGEITGEAYWEKLKKIRIQQEKEISDVQIGNLDEMIDGIAGIGSALQRAFGDAGGDLVQQMFTALQLGLQLAKAIQSATKPGASGLESILGIFGPLIGLFGLGLKFQTGGEVPSGSYVVNERMAAKHKDILDALGAEEVRGGTPHKDSVIAKTGDSAVALTPKERILPPALAYVGKLLNEDRITPLQKQIVHLVASSRPFVLDFAGGRQMTEQQREVVSAIKGIDAGIVQRQLGGNIGAIRNDITSPANIRLVSQSVNIDNEYLRDEIVRLRRDVAALNDAISGIEFKPQIKFEPKIEVKPPEVNLRGTLSGQKFLKDEMPGFEKFNKKKNI